MAQSMRPSIDAIMWQITYGLFILSLFFEIRCNSVQAESRAKLVLSYAESPPEPRLVYMVQSYDEISFMGLSESTEYLPILSFFACDTHFSGKIL
jgi:hypothetical protein